MASGFPAVRLSSKTARSRRFIYWYLSHGTCHLMMEIVVESPYLEDGHGRVKTASLPRLYKVAAFTSTRLLEIRSWDHELHASRVMHACLFGLSVSLFIRLFPMPNPSAWVLFVCIMYVHMYVRACVSVWNVILEISENYFSSVSALPYLIPASLLYSRSSSLVDKSSKATGLLVPKHLITNASNISNFRSVCVVQQPYPQPLQVIAEEIVWR